MLTALIVIGVLCGFLYFIYSREANGDYEGRIVDRWADYSEGDQGSHPYFRLRVESDDGKRFTVKVDPNVYESARVGMRIKNRSGQIVLIDSQQTNIDH